MPGILIKTSAPFEEKKDELFAAVTKLVVEKAEKKESGVMVILEKVEARKGNKDVPVAFVEVRSLVGLDHAMNRNLAEGFCEILGRILGINNEHIYINFMRIPETTWGWKGGIVMWDHAQKQWVVR
jgi:phenylpyruvate tautomerase PptA (4-oxalocrotonate tautomerase family)